MDVIFPHLIHNRHTHALPNHPVPVGFGICWGNKCFLFSLENSAADKI